jgi:hypothetical protein
LSGWTISWPSARRIPGEVDRIDRLQSLRYSRVADEPLHEINVIAGPSQQFAIFWNMVGGPDTSAVF